MASSDASTQSRLDRTIPSTVPARTPASASNISLSTKRPETAKQEADGQVRRQQFVESLPTITKLQIEQPTTVKVENVIGYAAVPVGIAGPLTITGDHQKSTVFAPLATTESTLVASCARGCKAFQASGGVKALATREAMSRSPIFRFNTVDDAVRFWKQLPALEPEIRASARSTSRYAKLISITPHIISREVHVKFCYTCGDASGQNMTTIATHKACQDLLKRYGKDLQVVGFQIEGQLATDKKLSLRTDGDPRGVEVMAWGVLSDETCRRVLGQPAEAIHLASQLGRDGSIRGGMCGNNVNTANILAAMFIACGQDAASVLESGWSQLTTAYDYETKELTATLFIPSLVVASVGGGTAYATQKEALGLVGCVGEGRKWALAETICAFALALDLSTLSAVGNDTFSQSHARLARPAKL